MPLYMIERNFAEEHLVNKDHTDNDLAAVLVRRGRPEDAARAESLAAAARESAARFGMAGLAARAGQLLTTP